MCKETLIIFSVTHVRRLAALDDPTVARPVLPSAGVPRPKAPHTDKYANPADQDIAQRLGKLKEDRGVHRIFICQCLSKALFQDLSYYKSEFSV